MAMITKVGDVEIIKLDGPMDDWTGATHVLRSQESPGGIIILVGGASVNNVEGNELARRLATALQEIK